MSEAQSSRSVRRQHIPVLFLYVRACREQCACTVARILFVGWLPLSCWSAYYNVLGGDFDAKKMLLQTYLIDPNFTNF